MVTRAVTKPDSREPAGKRGGRTSTSFKPGQSGNPGGRPKLTDEERTLTEMCKAKTPEAMATVLKIMRAGENDRSKLAAAQFIIERGWGKAMQSVEHSTPDGRPFNPPIVITFVSPRSRAGDSTNTLTYAGDAVVLPSNISEGAGRRTQ